MRTCNLARGRAMEIYALKYFLAVAEFENVHRAAQSIHVSPASLSKAIAKLEDELDTSLFEKVGRNIKLTEQGRYFQQRARELADLEETIRVELAGSPTTIHCVIAGRELLLGRFGVEIADALQTNHPEARIQFLTVPGEEALSALDRGNAHLTLTTQKPPPGFAKSKIGTVEMVTVAGKGHKLYRRAKRGEEIHVDEVLEFGFVSPRRELFGRVSQRLSFDGWRDDQFPRRIDYQTDSIYMITSLISEGKALAYVPRYFAENLGYAVIDVGGCDFSCELDVYLSTKRHDQVSWLGHLVDHFKG